MKRVMALSVAALLGQGCVYGVVKDANTGSAISAASIKVVSGNCYGGRRAGCPDEWQRRHLHI